MGLDVVGISRAHFVQCRGEDDCNDSHYTVGSFSKRRDRLRVGCYVVGKGGRTFGFRAGSYTGYDDWRRELSRLALHAEPEDVWKRPRRFTRKPFVELIDFPDSVGPVIGPATSAKLYMDFAAFSTQARRHYLIPRVREIELQRGKRRRKTRRPPHMNQAGLAAVASLTRMLGVVVGVVAAAESEDLKWMWEVYRGFRRVFKLASDRGFVVFE